MDGDSQPPADGSADAEQLLSQVREELRDQRQTVADARAEGVRADAARLHELLREADARDRAAEVREAAARLREAAAQLRRADEVPDEAADRQDRAQTVVDREWAGRDRDEAAADRDEIQRLTRGADTGDDGFERSMPPG